MAKRTTRKRRKFDNTIKRQYQSLTQEQVAERWRMMRPRYWRWLAMFASLAVLLFFGNRTLSPSQGVVNVINVGFQIALIFGVMFSVMIVMSYVFGGKGETAASAS